MTGRLGEGVLAALGGVRNPRDGRNLVESNMVRDLVVSDEGRVRLSLVLAAQDPASLVREARRAVEGVDGVREVRVDIRDPAQAGPAGASRTPEPTRSALGAENMPPAAHSHGAAAAGASGGPPARARALPVIGQETAKRPNVPSAPTPVAYPHLGRVLAISSGKGGVGKSTVASNLALALVRTGARVGLMDGDIYGPNIPRMMGVNEPPPVVGQRIQPLNAYGVKLMSLGFIITRDQPAIWRGPIVMKVITQFLRDVEWGELDYLLVDLPPGTGDAQLSLVQATHVAAALIVTTPQEVATGDALRGAKMFERVDVPVLGIVENMSSFVCPHCGEATTLFGGGGGRRLADELQVPLLGEIPFVPEVAAGGDEGKPIVATDPDSPAARALIAMADRVRAAIEAGVSA